MKINTKVILKNLKNEPLKNESGEPLTLGEALSNIISNYKIGGKMKTFLIAKNLIEKKEVELDSADFTLLKDACDKDELYISSIVSGQCLVILNDLKK